MKEEEKTENRIFAKGMCFSKIFWIFMIGSFFGCIYEVILSRFQTGHFESRAGVVFGPFNPVYGLGLVIIVLFLYRLQNPFLQIFVGTVVGGLTEYIIWFLQRVLFLSESWNYKTPFVHDGRPILSFLFWGGTSFFHALFWGLAGFIVIRFFYPKIDSAIEQIPYKAGKILTIIFTVFMIVNILLTAVAIVRQNERHYCSIETNTCVEKSDFEKSIDSIIDGVFSDEYLSFVFPNMDQDPKNEKKI